MTSSSTTELGNDGRSSIVEFPHIETLDELDSHIEKTYGPDVLRTLRDSTLDQAKMVEQLHQAGLNGRSEAIERTYRLHQQEFARKETLLGTTWRWTKEAASATADALVWPFKKSWAFAKKHPVVSTLIVGAALAGGVYLLWGIPIPIPNPSIGAGEVADAVAAPTGGLFDALPQADIVPPNFTNPYVPEVGPLPDIPVPDPTGSATEWFRP